MTNFQNAAEMPYANSDQTKQKALFLIEELKKHLKTIKFRDAINRVSTAIYIPDLHGDFIHLIITLHRHNLLDEGLNLKKDYKYIFLGDFYDRAPDADVIDFWLNNQIKNNAKIYRLIGNHEMAFFERDERDYPVIFPSQDSIKDISNDFQITENILKNIASGNILAAYAQKNILYVHSYIICDDFTQLGLEKNTDILNFVIKLNERFKNHGEVAYEIFLDCKKKNKYNWKEIMKSFNCDPLFNIYKEKDDISTSFLWRRTGLPTLNIYPCELGVEIPNDVYQIVGHTPVFSFNLPKEQLINEPFVLSGKNSTGKVQFSDVGIGYYYRDDFERPEVTLTSSPKNIFICS